MPETRFPVRDPHRYDGYTPSARRYLKYGWITPIAILAACFLAVWLAHG